MENPALIVIPGAATDWRMYTVQRDVFPNLIIPEWLTPLSPDEPLSCYARRLVATLNLSGPYIFGGVSLGGMIAQEMALCAEPLGLILIATCDDSRAVPWYLRKLGQWVRRWPDRWIRFTARILSHTVPVFLTKHPAHRRIYAAMLRELPPDLVRWQSGSATEWKRSAPPTVPIFHLHASQDAVIRCKETRATEILPKGGHFISVTHADEVNRFIAGALAALGG